LKQPVAGSLGRKAKARSYKIAEIRYLEFNGDIENLIALL
jgi:hypothetical protein